MGRGIQLKTRATAGQGRGSSRSMATAWNFPLGIEGFRYADLNRVRRLMALHQVFCDDLQLVDPALAQRYQHSGDHYSRG